MNRNTPFEVIQGIVLLSVATQLVTHADGFIDFIVTRYQGYCPYCGYKLNHPVVKHDEVIGECGWR